MQPSILIADDHSMIRKGMKLYLQFNLDCTDITEVSSCNELMTELGKKKFTHLILDIILTDGSTLEVIPDIREAYPEIELLIFSMQPQDIYGQALEEYGIRYYISKTSDEEEIISSLHKFLQNETPAPSPTHNTVNPFKTLARRELEVLHYVLKGADTKEIAEILNLKMNTVFTLETCIYEKTNAGNIKELIELATLYNVNF